MASSAALGTVLLQKPSFETFAENHASIFQWITAAKNPIFGFLQQFHHPSPAGGGPAIASGAGVRRAKTAGKGRRRRRMGTLQSHRLPASPTRAGLAIWPTAVVSPSCVLPWSASPPRDGSQALDRTPVARPLARLVGSLRTLITFILHHAQLSWYSSPRESSARILPFHALDTAHLSDDAGAVGGVSISITGGAISNTSTKKPHGSVLR